MLTRLFTLVTITILEVLGVEGKLKLLVTLSTLEILVNFVRNENMKNVKVKVYIFVEDVHSAGRPCGAAQHFTNHKYYSRSEQT